MKRTYAERPDPEEIETYRRDAVSRAFGCTSEDWLEVVRRFWSMTQSGATAQSSPEGSPGEGLSEPALEHSHLHALGTLGDVLETQGMDVLRDREARSADGQFILVNNAVLDYPAVQRLAFESPLAELAAQLFGSDKVNFLFDHLHQAAGASTRTRPPGLALPRQRCARWHRSGPRPNPVAKETVPWDTSRVTPLGPARPNRSFPDRLRGPSASRLPDTRGTSPTTTSSISTSNRAT